MKLSNIFIAAAAAVIATGASARDIDIQSYISGSLPILGSEGVLMRELVSVLTGGSLNLHFKNPGEIVNATQAFNQRVCN